MFNIDFFIFQQINNWAGQWAWLDMLAIFFAEYLGYVLVFCLLLFLAKNLKKYWPMIWQAILAGILSRLVFTEIIRWIFPKSRPFIENNVNLLLNHTNSSAFPSGHAAFYFAIAAVVYFHVKREKSKRASSLGLPSERENVPQIFWRGLTPRQKIGVHFYNKKIGLLFFIVSFLICISRVFCGIHWPLDILAGAIVGIFSGWLIIKIFKK